MNWVPPLLILAAKVIFSSALFRFLTASASSLKGPVFPANSAITS